LRYRGRAFYFVETALSGGRSRKMAIQSKNKHGNALMIGSNNAGPWKVLARFFGKRVTIYAAANSAGRAMLAGGY
jgi:hypothetical protein